MSLVRFAVFRYSHSLYKLLQWTDRGGSRRWWYRRCCQSTGSGDRVLPAEEVQLRIASHLGLSRKSRSRPTPQRTTVRTNDETWKRESGEMSAASTRAGSANTRQVMTALNSVSPTSPPDTSKTPISRRSSQVIHSWAFFFRVRVWRGITG